VLELVEVGASREVMFVVLEEFSMDHLSKLFIWGFMVDREVWWVLKVLMQLAQPNFMARLASRNDRPEIA
jgi:hypothetical protein